MTEPTIYIIDDDKKLCATLSSILSLHSLNATCFHSAESALDALPLSDIGCILLDIRMGEMNGIELQQKLIERDNKLPIIFLTGHANVRTAVKAVKDGAFEFLEKPFDNSSLVKVVQAAVANSLENNERMLKLKSLSPREYEVFTLLVKGKLNKRIAEELKISISTIEFHRANILTKLNASSLEALISLA